MKANQWTSNQSGWESGRRRQEGRKKVLGALGKVATTSGEDYWTFRDYRPWPGGSGVSLVVFWGDVRMKGGNGGQGGGKFSLLDKGLRKDLELETEKMLDHRTDSLTV